MIPTALVVAKAPVPGQVKTRLGADIGMGPAAELAALALLDTLAACTTAFGAERCHLALTGDLARAVCADELRVALAGWQVTPQRGEGLGERLAHAHADVAGPRLQIGMDTPQLTPDLLRSVADGLGEYDAVLGEATDGGWWVLALREPTPAQVLPTVPMSTATTYDDTLAALQAEGLHVWSAPLMVDVDQRADADAVAATAPWSRFAQGWLRGGIAR